MWAWLRRGFALQCFHYYNVAFWNLHVFSDEQDDEAEGTCDNMESDSGLWALTAPRSQIDGRGTGSVVGRPEVLSGVLSSCTKSYHYPSSPSETVSELMKAHRRSTTECTSESTALELVH